jgi:serine/alanine adding enzyme
VTTVITAPEADPRWDAYVAGHPQATAYHLAAWSPILATTTRARPRHLALEDDGGRLTGVLPLMERRGVMTGTRLRSLPGMPVAGPLADDDSGARRLLAAARDLAAQRDAALAVSSRLAGLDAAVDGIASVAVPPTWLLALPASPDELRARFKRGSRLARGLRTAESSGLTVREASGDGDLRAFHRLYAATMRRHQVLPRSLRQLRLARRMLGTIFRLFLVEDAGRPVAGGLFHAFNGTLELLYNASDERALAKRPNHLLYWHASCWAIEHGLRTLDFGYAGKDSSLGAFKAQWGAEPVDEQLYVHPPAAAGDASAVGGAEAISGPVERLATAVVTNTPVPLLSLAAAIGHRWL